MKVHLIDANEPLKSGATMQANCGEEIRNTEFAFMFDMEYVPDADDLSSLRLCRKCRVTRLAKRYVYGILNGQETKGAAA